MTKDLKYRVDSHAKEDKFQLYSNLSIQYTVLLSKRSAELVESMLIAKYKPVLNVTSYMEKFDIGEFADNFDWTTYTGDVISLPTADKDTLQFGQMLQGYREQAKVTQQEIADATGLTKNYISSIERGVHKCNAQTFIIYAKKCGVSLDEMAGLIPKSKLNRNLIKKISEMSKDEQERALKILELMN
jgi:transcriptional regulator with XRE-family HTH domain